MKLFPDQVKCLETINNNLGREKILVQAPTGYGKTVVLSKLLADNQDKKALVCFNKIGLIDQTIDKLDSLNAFLCPTEVGTYNGSLGKRQIDARIVVGTVQSLVKATSDRPFDFIIFDECHRSNMENKKGTFYKIAERFPHTNLIGFTATPFTSSGPIYGKDRFWPKPIYSATTKEMIEMGRLVPLKFAPLNPNLSINTQGIKVSAGEFNLRELSDRAAVWELVMAQIKDALKRIEGYKFPIFMCVSIEHCEMVAMALGNASIVHSKMTMKERDKNIEDFKTGKTSYLVSVLVLSEGFDFPPADCLVLIRPTKSHVLFVQATGRVLRVAPGKDHALLLDYGNVCTTLGNPLTIRASDIKKRSNQKICELCNAPNPVNAKKCEECFEAFMVMCQKCFELKFAGEDCEACPVDPYIEGSPQKEYLQRLLEKTELKPYSPQEESGIFMIDDCKIFLHTSKAGNKLFKFAFKDKNNAAMSIFAMPKRGWRGNGYKLVDDLMGINGEHYDYNIDIFFDSFGREILMPWGKSTTVDVPPSKRSKEGFIFVKEDGFYKIKDWI